MRKLVAVLVGQVSMGRWIIHTLQDADCMLVNDVLDSIVFYDRIDNWSMVIRSKVMAMSIYGWAIARWWRVDFNLLHIELQTSYHRLS